MKEIFDYLNNLSYMDPRVIKRRLMAAFDLDEKQTEEIYAKWKKEFMRFKYKEIKENDRCKARENFI